MPFGSLDPIFSAMTGIGTLGLALVSLQGIQAWKQQRIWEHGLDVGRQILRDLRALEDACVRAFDTREVISKMEEWERANGNSRAPIKNEKALYAYRAIHSDLLKVISKLDVSVSEASTIWGDACLFWHSNLMGRVDEFGVYAERSLLKDAKRAKAGNVACSPLDQMRHLFDVYNDTPELGEDIPFQSSEYTQQFHADIEEMRVKVREKMEIPR